MAQGKFLLNPHAAPYIPLSRNIPGTQQSGGDYKATKKVWSEPENNDDVGKGAGHQLSGFASVENNSQSLKSLHVSDKPCPETNHLCSSDVDTVHDENAVVENKSIMMTECLLDMFPDYSRESLAELLNANGGDFDGTIDMLELLESEGEASDEFPESSQAHNNSDSPFDYGGYSGSSNRPWST